MYTIPPKSIRGILLKENEERMQHYNQVLRNDPVTHDPVYMREAMRVTREKIETLCTYEKLEDFVHDFYRISLQEWIDSL